MKLSTEERLILLEAQVKRLQKKVKKLENPVDSLTTEQIEKMLDEDLKGMKDG